MTAQLALVDDDPAFTGYLETLLRSRGYTVEVFHSGGALLESLRAGATPHVILLDVLMPDLDGLETLRAIRHAHPSSRVIMLSGRQAPATIVEAVRLGAADYVLKPDDPEGVGEAALEAAIRNALEREALSAELARLSAQMAEDPEGAQPCWSSGPAMQPVVAMVERIADSDVGVLLRGESGVGKEVIARELHRRSPRRTKPFVKVNCAALPSELLESELFGHERGAFTGAGAMRVGKFEFAQHGTIMLDEIGELPGALQAKLLHVLQDRELTRLGSNRPVEVDVRVLAATNRDLEAMMRAGTFREDLYYRLQVIELRVPPLRERREEIPALVEFFLVKFAKLYRRPAARPSPVLMDALFDYAWPGNIRELENMMKRFVVLQEEALVLGELMRLRQAATPAAPVALPSQAPAPPVPVAAAAPAPVPPPDTGTAAVAETARPAPVPPESVAAAAVPPAPAPASAVAVLDEPPNSVDTNGGSPDGVDLQLLAKTAALRAEREAIDRALVRFRWNRRKAAQYLNVSYKTLLNKIKECGISESGPN
ncbi:MAG TPA: sigma-54 dependent transcriptional regulator [Vicinamibacterales bacterium]|nr:sigma-54 dependent transcriptional regulator [Vicinamibacterales bacterium]